MPTDDLSIQIGAEDRTKAAFRSVQRSLETTSRSATGVGIAATRAGAALGLALGTRALPAPLRLGAAILRVRSNLMGLPGAARNAASNISASFARVSAALRPVGTALTRLQGLLTGIGKAAIGSGLVAGGAVAAGLTAIGRRGVETNVSLGRVRSGLEVMLKSGTAAGAVLRQLQKDAMGTTFSFTELADLTKRMIGFGFKPTEARSAILTLGDVGFGLAGEEGASALLDRLVLAVGKIKAQGRMMGDSALQLMEAGVNVRQIMGIQSGTNIADADISSDAAIPKLLAGLRKQFGGMMAAGMNSLPGIQSNIGDAMDALSSKATKGLTASLTKAGQNVLSFLNGAQEGGPGSSLLAGITKLFDGLGNVLVRVTNHLPQIAEWITKLGQNPGWKQFGQAAMMAVRLVGGGIAGVINMFVELFASQAKSTQTMQAMAESTKRFSASTVRLIGKVAAAYFGLQAAIALATAASAAFATLALTKNPGAALTVGGFFAKDALVGGAGAIASLVGSEWLAQKIEGVDTSNIGLNMSKMSRNAGAGGAFARGFIGFNSGVTGLMKGMAGIFDPAAPTQAGAPPTGPAAARAPSDPFSPRLMLPRWAQQARIMGRPGALAGQMPGGMTPAALPTAAGAAGQPMVATPGGVTNITIGQLHLSTLGSLQDPATRRQLADFVLRVIDDQIRRTRPLAQVGP